MERLIWMLEELKKEVIQLAKDEAQWRDYAFRLEHDLGVKTWCREINQGEEEPK